MVAIHIDRVDVISGNHQWNGKMTAFSILTDSTATLSKNAMDELKIRVIPQRLILGETVYSDQIDTTASLNDLLLNYQGMPKTSQASPGEFETKFLALSKESQNILVVLLSSELSGTFNSAVLAKSNLPQLNIHIVDTRNISIAVGMAAIYAARARKSGKSFQETISVLDSYINSLRFIFAIEESKYILSGGRLGRFTQQIGQDLLKFRYLFSLVEGKIVPIEKLRTRKQSDQALVQEVLRSITNKEARIEIGVSHSAAPDRASGIARLLSATLSEAEVSVCENSPVLMAHSGPGAIGIGWCQE